jgi:predicted nucleic acid-binding protein
VNCLPVYLDSSAIVKLITPEAESSVLFDVLDRWPDRVSSALSRVEVERALWRAAASRAVRRRAEQVLASMTLVRIDEAVLMRASRFRTPSLRTGDAIQLATAISLGDDPEAFITYDERLAAAARAHGLAVLHPGA